MSDFDDLTTIGMRIYVIGAILVLAVIIAVSFALGWWLT